MTPSVVTGNCISPKTWYFHRTTVKLSRVWHFDETRLAVEAAIGSL